MEVTWGTRRPFCPEDSPSMVVESEQSVTPSISSQFALVPDLKTAICCTCRTGEEGFGNGVMTCQVIAKNIHAMKAVHALVLYASQFM